MAIQQRSRFCKGCGAQRLFVKHHFSSVLGLVLTAITGGLFLLIWLPVGLCEMLTPFRCQQCGGK